MRRNRGEWHEGGSRGKNHSVESARGGQEAAACATGRQKSKIGTYKVQLGRSSSGGRRGAKKVSVEHNGKDRKRLLREGTMPTSIQAVMVSGGGREC